MEALLPSEIARLVFGYLEDQKCDDAARSFLETSPHLQECRTAVLSGRRFNTRVNGYTLVDIFDKFSAAHSLVQERLTKVGDCEQVRQCGDLLEQLRFLIGGSRGQRFVVNINVPSQTNSQTYGGSPIITSSIRKRQHSGSDRDRTKRIQKSLHQLYEKQPEPVSSQLGCDTVEATPLESLPGHTNSSIPHRHEHTTTRDSDGVYCTSTKNDFTDCPPSGELQSISKQICHHPSSSNYQRMEQDNSSGKSDRCSPVLALGEEKKDEKHKGDEGNRNSMGKGKTMATSTDELTTYSSIEVQTTPYALSDSESIGLDDEPIENLSLLTKELLNRTELQEKIAENINKAILPIDMPSKDESICESMGGELNTSIMAELNNAIKSIVAATETDPIFEHFLDEIIGPNIIDTDTSPDEDPDVRAAPKPAINSRIQEEPSNTVVVDMDLEEETAVISNKGLGLIGATEIPLKQRLRSSSRQQNNKLEDDGDKPKELERTDSSLEDHNAAAIMSIINANIVSDKSVAEKNSSSGNNAVAKPAVVVQSPELSQAAPISSESQVADSTEVVENDRADVKSTEKQVGEKSICTKLNPETQIDRQEFITEQEMMAMPTLIVSSREEMQSSLNVDTLYSSGNTVPCSEARFIPIAPKVTEVLQPMEPLYLRAVQVPLGIPKKVHPATSNTEVELMKPKPISPPKLSNTSRKRNRKMPRRSKNPAACKPGVTSTNVIVDTESPLTVNKEPSTSNTDLESITLYANDNSFGTMIETGNMPAINLDDSMTLTGTGLSPYLKFNDSKSFPQQSELACEKVRDEVPIEELVDTGQKTDVSIVLPHTENILITRRTPKSLLKSRSKNNRLSLSTPRRRSSHIRALDFNTPMKSSSSEHKSSGNKSHQFSSKSSKRARSVCRTSLFKSPPFSNSFNASERAKTPRGDRQLYKVPIATRSPAPKLMGGWDKYTGVGMILGGTSPHPSSTPPVFEHEEPQPPIKSSSTIVKKSWDADLRQALQEYQVPTDSTSVTKKGPARVKGRASKNSSTDVEEKVSKSENRQHSDRSKRDKIAERRGSEKINHQIVDNVRDNIPNTSTEVEKSSETLTRVECPLSSRNTESKVVRSDPQFANLRSQDKPVSSDKTEISKNDEKIGEKGTSEIEDSRKPKKEQKQVVKKYAKLKTLETKISRSHKVKIIESSATSCSADSSQKKCEYLKISSETQSQPAHMSSMVDLETPRKTDNSTGIPPTPRLLSPSSSTITPFTKIAEELSNVHSFVSTPDFPPTPCIALTPKVMGQNTIDAIKKGDYGTCSPYYQPSNEQPDILEKLISGSNNGKENAAEIPPVTSPVIVGTSAVIESGSVSDDFGMITSSGKLEITQFEVIKENLPKEEADRELKISTNLNNTEEILPRVENPGPSKPRDSTESENIIKQSSYNEQSSSSSRNESSDSSSSDTSSSSSCSSSCSCSSIATTSTPFKSATKCKTKSNTYRDTSSNDCGSKNLAATIIDHNLLDDISPIIRRDVVTSSGNNKVIVSMQIVSSFASGETSPVKLIPLIKTQEEVDASAKETPAKDEALLSEANISETPSSSKSGIESLTNLNSKISAFNSPEDRCLPRHINTVNKIHVIPPARSKPKIISVQHLLPDVSIALKPPLVSEIVTSTTQSTSNLSTLSSVALDAKLGSHLEEKRLRLMAKLKNKPEPKIMPQKVKNRFYKNKHDLPKSSGLVRKACVGRAASHDQIKKATQISDDKEVDVRHTKIGMKWEMGSYPNDVKTRVIKSEAASRKLSSQDRKYDKCTKTQGTVKKLTNIDRQKSSTVEKKDDDEPLKSKKIARTEDPLITEKEEDRRRNTEISDKDVRSQKSGDIITAKVDSEQSATKRPLDSTELIKDLKVSNKTIDPTHSTNLIPNESERRDSICKKNTTVQMNAIEEQLQKVLPSRSEDGNPVVENTVVPIKQTQIVPMSKVDQIKRDLFSDEENSDQRTTRSRTRQLSDAQKSDPILVQPECVPEIEAEVCESSTKTKPKEELASVLECLKLVPANKNEIVEKTNSMSPKSSINKFAEYEFIYDDSIPIKKKRLKFSNINLQYVINVELRDENYRECPKLMTSTNYEEIFNISPKPKKRLVAKKMAIKSSKPTKAEASKATSSIGTILKNELVKPSAPISSSAKLKATISKAGKNTTKNQHKNLKPTDKDDKKKLKDDNQVLKKRKLTDSEEDQSGEKKRRTADPQTLLKKLDLDLFLNSVHGPI